MSLHRLHLVSEELRQHPWFVSIRSFACQLYSNFLPSCPAEGQHIQLGLMKLPGKYLFQAEAKLIIFPSKFDVQIKELPSNWLNKNSYVWKKKGIEEEENCHLNSKWEYHFLCIVLLERNVLGQLLVKLKQHSESSLFFFRSLFKGFHTQVRFIWDSEFKKEPIAALFPYRHSLLHSFCLCVFRNSNFQHTFTDN